jgi:hypothetical protein
MALPDGGESAEEEFSMNFGAAPTPQKSWQTQFFFGRNFPCCERLHRQMSLPTVANSVAKWQTQSA